MQWQDYEKMDCENEVFRSKDNIDSEEMDAKLSEKNKNRTEENNIWQDKDILQSLQTFHGFDTLFDAVLNEKIEDALSHPSSSDLGIILSSWMGKSSILKELLYNYRSNIDVVDSQGRSSLHLAAWAGNVECTKLLLENNCTISKLDNFHKITALHCASARGNLLCIQLLLQHGAEVNAGLTARSPLHFAVQSLEINCVKALLEHGANPNTLQVFSEAPLHVAAEIGSPDIIQLLLQYGASVQVQCGHNRSTALHLAVEDGNTACAQLLLDANADISATNRKSQTPLHLAALSQAAETLELLLRRGANPNTPDIDGRTALHCAIVKVSRSSDCVKLLLEAGANVNQPDLFGYTPLHLAALNEFPQCVMLLINNGGDVTARTNGGITVLTFITRRTPEVIPEYIKKIDAAVRLTDHEAGDVDCEVKLDFRVLVPTKHKRETELLLNFIEVGHRDILKHPLCETFLCLKWRRIRKFFLFSLFYHSLYVLLYSIYVIGVFLRNCPSSRRMLRLPQDNCTIAPEIKIIGYCIVLLNVLLMLKEIFQIAHGFSTYMKQWENWLQWMNIISIFCCVYPNNDDIRQNMYSWQHHVAAIGIFLAWLELEMIVGRFPIFGLYVQMFTTVAINFAKFFLAYACLLIAFGLSFGVLFANYPAFQDLKWGIMKTIIMMSGELEFEDLFYAEDYKLMYPVTAHIIYLIFVLLVTIILTNLMVGLAVSDIQGLLQSAGLDRLVRQVELMAHLESMLFSRLLKWLPQKCLNELHKQASLLKSDYHYALYIKPNDPRESRIPKDLIQKVYKLVITDNRARVKNKIKLSHGLSKGRLNENGIVESQQNSRINSIYAESSKS